jgi:pimeloyl-ACP methyl ester carboxylesterase
MVSAEDASALQQLIPRLDVVNIAGAGHCIHREQFAPYMAVVQDFLAKPR